MLLALLLAAAAVNPAIADELDRLRGQKVEISAAGDSYTIIDIASEGPPMVGVVERRGAALWLVPLRQQDNLPQPLRLTGPLAKPRTAGPGYKVWVIGEIVGEELRARRLGVLARPTAVGFGG